jgi:hypothetical protein
VSDFSNYLSRYEGAENQYRRMAHEGKLREFANQFKVFAAEQTNEGIVVHTGVGNITVQLQFTPYCTHEYVVTIVSADERISLRNFAILVDHKPADVEFIKRFANELQHAIQILLNRGLFSTNKIALITKQRPMTVGIRGMCLEREIVRKAVRSKRQTLDLRADSLYTQSLDVVAPMTMVDVCGPVCGYYIVNNSVRRVSFAKNTALYCYPGKSDYTTAMHLKAIKPPRMPLNFEQIHQNQVYFADSFKRAYKRVREEIRRLGDPIPQVEIKPITEPLTADEQYARQMKAIFALFSGSNFVETPTIWNPED